MKEIRQRGSRYLGRQKSMSRFLTERERRPLVYGDPPFNSKQQYNQLYALETETANKGTRAASLKAFDDTWHQFFDKMLSNGWHEYGDTVRCRHCSTLCIGGCNAQR